MSSHHRSSSTAALKAWMNQLVFLKRVPLAADSSDLGAVMYPFGVPFLKFVPLAACSQL